MSPRGSSSSNNSISPNAQAQVVAPGANLQPFQCLVCGSRFTRHENLKRHSMLHRASLDESKFPCFHCIKVFARKDLRRRHIKKQHPGVGAEKATSESFQAEVIPQPSLPISIPQQSSTESSTGIPDLGTTDLSFLLGPSDSSIDTNNPFGASGSYNPTLVPTPSAFSIESLLPSHMSKNSETRKDDAADFDAFMPNFDAPEPGSYISQASIPSPAIPEMNLSQSTIYGGVQIYFHHISPYLPFIHQPTFDLSSTPEVLIMGMLSVSMQFWQDLEEGSKIANYCFLRGRKLLSTIEQSEEHNAALNLSVIQSYVLLEIHAMLYAGGPGTTYGLRMHAKSLELARRGGLTEPYPDQAGSTGDLDSLWRQFIRRESHKRTLFAAHMLDTYWYHILSLPRILSHLEIKHDLPCSDEMWSVASATDWAHRSLIKNTGKSSMRYLSAVRAVLAPNPSLDLSTFDPYGSMIVILFLSSSVREVSGWSTMTGRVSFERFEALHSSLTVFEPMIQSTPDTAPMAVTMKATWHMAMIELLIWSPGHTNGVVEGSLDAALAAATHLSVAQSILSSPQVIASLDPHINWYLSYLHNNTDVYAEPPWVTIFAFKAALVAWQLVRAGVQESTDFLGITDTKAMYDWLQTVFERRTKWAIGRLVVKSLKELDVVL